MRVDYWVVEVICHYPGGPGMKLDALDERTRAQAIAHVEAGELMCLPDGCIAEAVARYAGEEAAHRERDRLLRRAKRGGDAKDYRVVMSTPIPTVKAGA